MYYVIPFIKIVLILLARRRFNDNMVKSIVIYDFNLEKANAV